MPVVMCCGGGPPSSGPGPMRAGLPPMSGAVVVDAPALVMRCAWLMSPRPGP